jgi:hypothetical protein
MKWLQTLNDWENGKYFTYPTNITQKFQWNTSVIKNQNSDFKEDFQENPELPLSHDMSSYKQYIDNSDNKYVVSFPNLSKDTMLVIPMPRVNKNYSTIKDFTDNSSKLQQKIFWKEVSKIIREETKKHTHIWVSAHGLGVPYFHLRICQKPKYYFNKKLSKK